MPEKEIRWKCTICGEPYPGTKEGKKLAKQCEGRGKPKKRIKVGQKLLVSKKFSIPCSGACEVTEVYRALHKPNRDSERLVHVVKVKVQNERGKTQVWHQLRVVKAIASGEITLVE